MTIVCKELIKIDMIMDDISLVKLTNLCREQSSICSFTHHFLNLNDKIQTFILTKLSMAIWAAMISRVVAKNCHSSIEQC